MNMKLCKSPSGKGMDIEKHFEVKYMVFLVRGFECEFLFENFELIEICI